MEKAWRSMALLLLMALLLSACGGADSGTPTVGKPAESAAPEPKEHVFSLWMAEDQIFSDSLEALVQDYEKLNPGMAPELRRFSSAEKMMEALAWQTPDLILVTEREAAQLLEREALGALAFPDEPEALFREVPGVAEGGLLPLGAALPLLVLREEKLPLLDGCDTLEAFCDAATRYAAQEGKPFFSGDCFAGLFADAMAQKGAVFHANRALDAESEAFCELYNLLAETAYEGGLIAAEEPVTGPVERGELICCLTDSKALAGYDGEGLAVLPLPALSGCEPLVEVKVYGVAALSGADAEKAGRFLGWLFADNRAAEVVMALGWAPAFYRETGEENSVTTGLLRAARLCRPCFTQQDSTAFEKDFHTAIAVLG